MRLACTRRACQINGKSRLVPQFGQQGLSARPIDTIHIAQSFAGGRLRALREARLVRPALVPAVCIIAMVAAFVIDLLTPQLFVTAILLDAPIVLSSLTRSSRFTNLLVAAALVLNLVAGYFNGVSEHYHWDPLGIGDRVLAALSIVFVGYLSTAVQQAAQRAGRLQAQQARAQREAQLAAAIERVRSSLSLDLVLRAIARETTTLFDIDRARFVLTDRANGVTLVARR